MKNPEGFERATGVNETMLQCMETGCHRLFRGRHQHERCPECGSDRVRDVKAGKAESTTASGPARMVTR